MKSRRRTLCVVRWLQLQSADTAQGGNHWVALEPSVFDALVEFRARTIEALKRGAAQW